MNEHVAEAAAVLVGAWGDRIAFGYLFRKLKPVTATDLAQMVAEAQPLFPQEVDWHEWCDLLERHNLLQHVTKERITQEFQKRRPDLVEAIKSDPNGMAWFDHQLRTLRINLGLEPKIIRFVKISNPL